MDNFLLWVLSPDSFLIGVIYGVKFIYNSQNANRWLKEYRLKYDEIVKDLRN